MFFVEPTSILTIHKTLLLFYSYKIFITLRLSVPDLWTFFTSKVIKKSYINSVSIISYWVTLLFSMEIRNKPAWKTDPPFIHYSLSATSSWELSCKTNDTWRECSKMMSKRRILCPSRKYVPKICRFDRKHRTRARIITECGLNNPKHSFKVIDKVRAGNFSRYLWIILVKMNRLIDLLNKDVVKFSQK